MHHGAFPAFLPEEQFLITHRDTAFETLPYICKISFHIVYLNRCSYKIVVQ